MDIINILIKTFVFYLGVCLLLIKFTNLKNQNVKKNFILFLCVTTSIIYLMGMFFLDYLLFFAISLVYFIILIKYKSKLKSVYIVPLVLYIFIFCYAIYIIVGIIPVSFFASIVIEKDSASFLGFRVAECFYLICIYKILHIKKLKQGISIFKNFHYVQANKKFISLLALFILIMMYVMAKLYNIIALEHNFLWWMFLFALLFICFFAFMWLRKEMDNHYKLKANEKTIENLLLKIDMQNEEIQRLTEVSKISHKTNHQIDVLKSKLKGKDCDDILRDINDLSLTYRESVNKINKKTLLQSTKVKAIDDVLEHILNEASENKIDFVIRINGSANYMIKNFIDEEKLVTILSDHLKNAIICINHSKNPFRSITLNIGEIGDYYGIAIHDTGIEFKINTLINLGLKSVTTHKKDGGTGIGFLTTFDTLKDRKASLFINERKPEDYNYTKTITILFDDLSEYRINSYRSKLINEKRKQKIVVTNKKMI